MKSIIYNLILLGAEFFLLTILFIAPSLAVLSLAGYYQSRKKLGADACALSVKIAASLTIATAVILVW